VFTDSPYGGDSQVSIKVLRRDQHQKPSTPSDRFYAEIGYTLGGDGKVPTPYCGVYAGFTPKERSSSDVSPYGSVALDAWHEGPIPEHVRFLLEIVPVRSSESYENQFLYDITEHIGNIQSKSVFIPFSEFRRRSKPGQDPHTTLEKDLQRDILQLSIIIEGSGTEMAQGRLCVDNMRFIR
jgi:hypothetical protein